MSTNKKKLISGFSGNRVQNAITETFEQHMQYNEETGREYWSARTLMVLFGYIKWQKFYMLLEQAKESCEGTGDTVSDHFQDTTIIIESGSGAKREIKDINVSRYGAYLITVNGDQAKPVIRKAKKYFTVMTRDMEIIVAARTDKDRLKIRTLIESAEIDFSYAIQSFNGNSDDQRIIRSAGDEALFTYKTRELKLRWGINEEKVDDVALADILGVELLNVKCQILNMTNAGYKQCEFNTLAGLQAAHIANGKRMRTIMIEQDLLPESIGAQLPIGSVTAGLNVSTHNSLTSAAMYKLYLESKNTTGYVGVRRVDGHYVGTVTNDVFTKPMDTKLLAMQAATSRSYELAVANAGKILSSSGTIIIPIISSLSRETLPADIESLVTGFLTHLINGVDAEYLSDILETKGVDVANVRAEMIVRMRIYPVTGYAVVERCMTSGLIISLYN